MSRFALSLPLAVALGLAPVLAQAGAPPAPVAAVAAEQDPSAFIGRLGQQAGTILADPNLGPAERKAALGKLVATGIDVPAIGKFALGRYWRTASPEQQQAYLDVFGRYLVTLYVSRLEKEAGRPLEVLGAESAGDATVVHSRFQRQNDAPLRLDWKVVRGDGGWRIVDLLVDDVSLAIAQRSDFTGAIEHGSLQALIDALKSKVDAG